jgi:hypothetical protein
MRSKPFLLSLIASTVVALSSCDRKTCSHSEMIKLATKSIKDEGRDPNEFKLDAIRQHGNEVYISFAQKISPLYHRYYLIDPRTCKIIERRFDQ